MARMADGTGYYLGQINAALGADGRYRRLTWHLQDQGLEIFVMQASKSDSNFLVILNDDVGMFKRYNLHRTSRSPYKLEYVAHVGDDSLYRLKLIPGRTAIEGGVRFCLRSVGIIPEITPREIAG